MDRKMLRDVQWARIERLLPGKASDRGVTAKDNLRFLEAVLWVMRAESPWRDLPAEYSHWHATYVRFSRWREKGVFERVAQAFVCDADTERLFLDSTIVRAHQHSSGAQKKPVVRKSGIPSAGQIADIEYAAKTIEHLPAQAVIADKGYDADHFVATIEAAVLRRLSRSDPID